ncbi:phosphoglycerate kinase [Ignatzschineria ureiclastica]|uniref:Phosphoglycerate kinase n=1 Tax=Ignatzschineria ureiclastica TaxID=472582 RepID=A0A2U2AD86_9GAMM|nr:phosphoglycerate kinase [Ignatzschineria ureiclastica]PWD80613.1 phosphoglycerate kinase [Ignatzschineria ureiclastica]GHA02216.1 phosphoglycerate kinase [Ignatzschineria ureiclastica]
MKFNTLDDLNLEGKRVLVREDLNVPIHDGVITSDARLEAALPTIQKILEKGGAVMVTSHLGRPTEGVEDEEFSLAPVAVWLNNRLGMPVPLVKNWINGVEIKPGEVKLLENVRFLEGEKKNDEALSKKMANLCDVYVMDAFATAHRKAASTYGVGMEAKEVAAGLLLEKELKALTKAVAHPEKPMVAIVGGAKVSTKLTVLNALLDKVDQLITGGGITNTLLLAKGYNVGNSLVEKDLVPEAKKLLARAESEGKEIPLPIDVVVGKAFSADAEGVVKAISDVEADDMIMDIGPQTIELYRHILEKAKTIVWNGPVGVFEFANFAEGTKKVGEAIAASSAFSIAGGGDTVSAVETFGIADKISYISTAGGAFLELLEGKVLPAVEMLEKRAN